MKKRTRELTFIITVITFIVILGVIVLLLASCGMPKSPKEAADRYTRERLPEGAIVLEWVQTATPGPPAYVIFEFRGQCYIQSRISRQGMMANVECPHG